MIVPFRSVMYMFRNFLTTVGIRRGRSLRTQRIQASYVRDRTRMLFPRLPQWNVLLTCGGKKKHVSGHVFTLVGSGFSMHSDELQAFRGLSEFVSRAIASYPLVFQHRAVFRIPSLCLWRVLDIRVFPIAGLGGGWSVLLIG